MSSRPQGAGLAAPGAARAVRVARVDDALTPGVLALSVAQAQRAFVAEPRDRLAEILADPHSEACAVLHGQEVIGFYRLDFHPLAVADRAFPAPSCGLRNFLIDARHQGLGYGRAAIDALVRDVAERHSRVRSLNLTVNVRNAAARRLYERSGFVVTGDPYLGGPSGPQHVMTLSLPDPRHLAASAPDALR